MTTIASVAFGSRPSSGATKSMVARAAAAVTREVRCERPPAALTTAVCEAPPPAGIAPVSAPARLLAPTATSSRFASTGGSPGWAKARAEAIDSVKLISAIPAAAGASWMMSERSGSVIDGSPWGILPMVETPSAARPKNHDAAMPRPTATSGAGAFGQSRSIATSTTSVATRHAERQQRGLGDVLGDAQQVGKEALLGDVGAEQLGYLVEHDHQADAGLEAGEHRRGNEVGDEAEAGHPGEHQHRPDQRGQRGGGGDQLGRVAVGHDDGELGAGEDRERGRRADAQHPRACPAPRRRSSG